MNGKGRSASRNGETEMVAFEHLDEKEEDPLLREHSKSSFSLWGFIKENVFCMKKAIFMERTINFRGAERDATPQPFPANVIVNQKYTLITFFPIFLYEQFRYFFNMYFLLVALSQFIPVLQIGFLFTYVAPLVFVLMITMIKEGIEDFKRFRRDKEANSALYERLVPGGTETIPSSQIKVGDLVHLKANTRVPADMVMLRTTEKAGTIFIRTDQLDGETDWKLRRAVAFTQHLPADDRLHQLRGHIDVEAPRKEIYNFISTINVGLVDEGDAPLQVESLGLEHTLWSGTVVASGTVIGLVVYTGKETRAVMNANVPSSKIGLLDLELNNLSKILFAITLSIAFLLTALKGFEGIWWIYFFRFVLLLSSIIPISLRVNLDLGKALYSFMIMRDKHIPETVVRTSTIPEELGRISYLFSDKTGTLTQNVMTFDTLQMEPPMAFNKAALPEIKSNLARAFTIEAKVKKGVDIAAEYRPNELRVARALRKMITSVGLCHNVTPVTEEDGTHAYQASSPDEVALVKFSESVGLRLEGRTEKLIELKTPLGEIESYDVLNIFPFTSETKRMGIIVRNTATGVIYFYLKGAESVMQTKIEPSDWLGEEVDNLARIGLRTLVFAQRRLDEKEYEAFHHQYAAAKAMMKNRDLEVANAIQSLEVDMELLGLTGVEDKLQEDVQSTLETLRNAGIKIWMLTGDKAETATCIARSARLVDRSQEVFPVIIKTKREAARQLDIFSTKLNTSLVVDGPSLTICLTNFEREFLELACQAPSVIACRCSPTQKAQIVALMQEHTGMRTAAIGDGGNDVNMIQTAEVGIGIVGKEGKQASLAADFSINQFSYIQRLLLWHGRNSYKRSARLSQFVIHRGLIISVIQAVFSALFYYAAIPIYNGWLLVGYATFYTMFPVFSLVLDEDVDVETVFLYPELYRELQKGRPLSFKTFFIWVWISFYQGGAIMIMAIVLFENNFINVVSITFTSLIFAELLNVALEINKWHWLMVVSQLFSITAYIISIFVLQTYFDVSFILTWNFVWKVFIITCISCLPTSLVKLAYRKFAPATHAKVNAGRY